MLNTILGLYVKYKKLYLNAEQQVWKDTKTIDDLPLENMIDAISKQAQVQAFLLKKLAVANYLSYFFPVLSEENQKDFNLLINHQLGLIVNEQQSSEIFEKHIPNLGSVINRFLIEDGKAEPTFDSPEFIHRKSLEPLHNKDSYGLSFPIITSKNFITKPETKDINVIAVVDCEYKELQSCLLANYILNLALTLQDYLNKNRNQNVTATLILKGRVPLFDIEKKLSVIEKLRGEPSPINPSPVPEVEIIYGISIPTTKEEFYFTLKQGRKTRLAKSNKKLQSKAAKEKYCQLKKIRSYLVIDKLINYASNEIEDYLSFINKFWVGFEEESEPTKNVPKWENFKEAKDKEEELLPIVSNKVNEFLKNTKVKDKKVNNEKVLTYVKSIAESVSNQEGLCFLDWNHIIVDAIKNKNYNKKRDEINIITPTILEKKNTYKDLFRNNCFLKFEKKDSNFLLTASEVPFIKETTNENNEIFNNIFFNILLIYFQLNIDKDYLKNYLSFVLSKIKTNKFNPFFKFKACLEDFKNSENKPKSEDFKNPENKPKSKELALLYADLSAVFNQVKDVSKKELIEEVKNIYSILDNAITERKAQEIQEESLVDNEEEIIKILTKTPLHSDISLSNIYCCLNKYKSKKLQNIKENECPFLDQLISLIQFDKSINVKFLYFFRIFFKPKNIVQYIYTIDEKDNVYVAHDDLVKRDQRPTHSELAHGCGVKAAGEMIFIKQKEKKEDEGENWYLHVINNGSGHYRPAAHKCLPTANDIIAPKLEENGIKKSSTFSLLNSLRPGMTLASGWDDLVESEEGSPRSEL